MGFARRTDREDKMSNPFVGTWIYRSFHNRPMPVQSFDEIKLAEAELNLTEEGPDWLVGKLVFKDGRFIDMTGVSTLADGRFQLRMRGSGAKDTPPKRWIYDYVGTLAAEWPDGDRQVPAIVGTVTRSAFHEPNRPTGETFSFIAVRSQPALAQVTPLPDVVRVHFADRLHRLHHTVWHIVRNNW